MDLYIVPLVVGGAGLLSMAMGGLDHHGGHGDAGGHGGHGDAGAHGGHADGHGGHAGGHGGHAGGHGGHAGHGDAGHAAHAHEAGGTPASHSISFERGASWLLSAPRVLFSVLLGLGATGLVLAPVLGGIIQAVAAIGGGFLFERVIITPIWNMAMKFESKPASTLESTLMDEATAVTNFDRNGEGIVSIELNGQVVQILARLRSDDRLLGSGVRAGQRVRIEDVDAARNRCTVSVL
jgi:hypothetical protein